MFGKYTLILLSFLKSVGKSVVKYVISHLQLTPENAIQAAVDFVRNLPSVDNLDEVGEIIFR